LSFLSLFFAFLASVGSAMAPWAVSDVPTMLQTPSVTARSPFAIALDHFEMQAQSGKICRDNERARRLKLYETSYTASGEWRVARDARAGVLPPSSRKSESVGVLAKDQGVRRQAMERQEVGRSSQRNKGTQGALVTFTRMGKWVKCFFFFRNLNSNGPPGHPTQIRFHFFGRFSAHPNQGLGLPRLCLFFFCSFTRRKERGYPNIRETELPCRCTLVVTPRPGQQNIPFSEVSRGYRLSQWSRETLADPSHCIPCMMSRLNVLLCFFPFVMHTGPRREIRRDNGTI
jgi:hypothetical protein